MSTSKTGIGGKRHSEALRSLTTTSLALLLLLVGGAWSPARATGPALWIAAPQQLQGPLDAVGGVVEIRPMWLKIGGVVKQIQVLEGAGGPLVNTSGLAFQPNGALWVCTHIAGQQQNNTILKFGVGQLRNLAVVPLPAPIVTITSTSFEFNMGCVFDSQGNLWVVEGAGNGVHEISHAQLIAATLAGPAPQNITPAVTITSTALSSPAFATFDAGGNLWVTSEGNNNIVEFAATDLGNPAATPHVIISSPSVAGPGQPQFDAAGNLWVTNALNNTVVKFTPAQLAASGSPTADATISDDGSGSLVTPWGCAFDSLGRLWVLNYSTTATSTTATISMFGRGQLAVSGPSSPTPRQTLDGLQPFAAQMTFGPRY